MNHVTELSAAAIWLMLLLGAYHGLNPGMGWLFAVALGMQEQKSVTVARSLVPIALGHALAVGGAVAIALALGVSLPIVLVRGVVAALLIGLGVFFLWKHWHPRWVRMRCWRKPMGWQVSRRPSGRSWASQIVLTEDYLEASE